MVENESDQALSEILRLGIARKEAGMPSLEEKDLFIKKVIPDLKQSFAIRHVENKNKIEHELLERKLQIEEATGGKISRPALCVNFLEETLVDEPLMIAECAFTRKNIPSFRFIFDFYNGAKITLGGITLAERELSDRGKDMRMRAELFMIKELQIPQGKEKDARFIMENNAKSYLAMLIKDPSGFKLVDELAREIESGQSKIINYNFQPKEYVGTGAQTARDSYKQIYALSKSLYLPLG